MMLRRLLAALILCLAPSAAFAVTCPSFSYTLTNGQTADANQVMANFNTLLTCSNMLLAPITSPTFTGTVTLPDGSSWSGAGLVLAAPITSPIFSGTITGTYTIGGSVTIDTPSILSPTFTGTTAEPDGSSWSLSGLLNATILSPTIDNATLANATIETPTISSPSIAGGILAAPTIETPTITSPTITGTCTGCGALSASFVTTGIAVPASVITVSQSLGGVPSLATLSLVNVTSNCGYPAGREVALPATNWISPALGSSNASYSLSYDASNLYVYPSTAANAGFWVVNPNTGAACTITGVDWTVTLRAWK